MRPGVLIEFDALDLPLLAALQRDASLTNVALADVVHASAATCLRRVKRLVDHGVIERRVALVRPGALGPSLEAIIEVSLDRQDEDALQAFAARASEEAAIRQCYRVSPGPDFVLIAFVGDMPGYQSLSARLFDGQSSVRHVRAFFVVSRIKFDTATPSSLPGPVADS